MHPRGINTPGVQLELNNDIINAVEVIKMNVNNVMNVYDMNSIWNSLNTANNSSNVPLVNNIDSDIKENYTEENYFGQTTDTELQNIYKQVEPDYGIGLSYDQNGNITIPSDISQSSYNNNSSILSLLNSNNSNYENSVENILSQYNSIESGTSTPNISSILSNNPYDIYSIINSL